MQEKMPWQSGENGATQKERIANLEFLTLQ
jgi:hypothetical protein